MHTKKTQKVKISKSEIDKSRSKSKKGGGLIFDSKEQKTYNKLYNNIYFYLQSIPKKSQNNKNKDKYKKAADLFSDLKKNKDKYKNLLIQLNNFEFSDYLVDKFIEVIESKKSRTGRIDSIDYDKLTIILNDTEIKKLLETFIVNKIGRY